MIPFNSETKKMTVVVELERDKRVRVFTKGASENIIDDCAYLLNANGGFPRGSGGDVHQQQPFTINLDLKLREVIKKNLNQMAEQSFRTIALGYKDITMEEFKRAIGELKRAES